MNKLFDLLKYSELADSFNVHPANPEFTELDLATINWQERNTIARNESEIRRIEEELAELPATFDRARFADEQTKMMAEFKLRYSEAVTFIRNEISVLNGKLDAIAGLVEWTAKMRPSKEDTQLVNALKKSRQNMRDDWKRTTARAKERVESLGNLEKHMLTLDVEVNDACVDSYLENYMDLRKREIESLRKDNQVITAANSKREELLSALIKLAQPE